MGWAARQHPVETLAEWSAPALLAAAAGWASRLASLPSVVSATVATMAFAVGVVAMRIAGKRHGLAVSPFEPVALNPAEAMELGELLLEPKDEVLILDDPLVDVAPDSRVVRLFTRQEPTPGELVERIADFLGDGRRAMPQAQAQPQPLPPTDASAALHAALANIRASLR